MEYSQCKLCLMLEKDMNNGQYYCCFRSGGRQQLKKIDACPNDAIRKAIHEFKGRTGKDDDNELF